MKFEVLAEIVAQAAECPRSFACLKGNGHTCCPVTEVIGREVHFIEPNTRVHCPYRLEFGGGSICQCPIRKDLYRRYGV
jgi:hypothetical protein